MNLPIKIKNKKPWVALNLYSSLLLNEIDFSNYEVSENNSGPTGYFGKAHITNLASIIDEKTNLDVTLYKDTLETFFYNTTVVIDGLIDFLYFSNPAVAYDPDKLDIILENAVNKITPNVPLLWKDSTIKNNLYGNISSSFLDYDMVYDYNTSVTKCKVIFRYLPEGSERYVDINLRTFETPTNVNVLDNVLTVWGDEYLADLKLQADTQWKILYSWNESIYQRELYRSIMSSKGGITIDEFYNKSYMLMLYTDKIDNSYISSLVNYSALSEDTLSLYSFNIICCLAEDTYNLSTINPGFTNDLQGWNRVSNKSSVTNNSNLISTGDLRIEDSILNDNGTDFELLLNGDSNKISQINRIPEGNYELTISIKTSIERTLNIFLNDTTATVTVSAGESVKKIKLTDVANGGISVAEQNSITEYGFELEPISDQNLNEEGITKIEYCRISKI
jgi:hypothetical protein